MLQAANELLNIIGIKASFVLTEYHDRIYISARSIDEINVQHRSGIDLYSSIVEATVSRTRPVLMAATTTIFGMVPLLFDVAFGGMAATIIFGLTFATGLTLFVTPALYSMFYKVKGK